jgi:hypothetical protein
VKLMVSLKPRQRVLLLLVPRLIVGRCTPTRLASYAIALSDAGNHRFAAFCWKLASRSSHNDHVMHNAVVDLCLREHQHEAAAALANSFYEQYGLVQLEAVRLIGNLGLAGAFDAALKVYDSLLVHCGGNLRSRAPALAFPARLDGKALHALLVECSRNKPDDLAERADIDLSLASLCFAFGAFDTCARLFDRVRDHPAIGVADRVAHAYSQLRSEHNRDNRWMADTASLVGERMSTGADWQVVLATTLFACGRRDAAANAVEKALREKFALHEDLDAIVEDCLAIVGHIWNCPEVLEFDASIGAPITTSNHGGVGKIFVCGSGWSGSGAVYDALMEYEGLAEAPDTPTDRYMSIGTDNEMMFVQGPSALGTLWRMAKEEREITRLHLWDMFRLHVIGGGAIGYSEYKSAKVAQNLLQRMGKDYTALFRRTFAGLSALPGTAPLPQLLSVLTETTEALSMALVELTRGAREGQYDCVLFNNAIFGANIDMLEIFCNSKAAVVVRDPLDQYADRRSQDARHWMQPRGFVSLYRAIRQSFEDRKNQLPPRLARQVREIEFERFVFDGQYRGSVIGWLLEGRDGRRRVRHRFNPEHSAENIGIHARLLAPAECRLLHRALKDWRRSRR